jgi:hypothetical protein
MPINRIISKMQKIAENARLRRYNKRVKEAEKKVAHPNPKKKQEKKRKKNK